MTLRIDVGTRPSSARSRGITAASAAVRRGELIVVPTESMYGLAADPFSARGMSALREAKGRDSALPVGVLVGSVRAVDGLARGITQHGRDLIAAFWPGPLTLIVREQPTLAWDLGGDLGVISVRMPLHPVLLDLLAATGPLAVTGAQRAGEPAVRTCDEAQAQLGDTAALYVDAGPCPVDLPSAIVDLASDPPALLREGGYDAATLRAVCPDLVGPEA